MKKGIAAAGCALFCLMTAQSALALTIDYSYSAFRTIPSWGKMDINVVNNSTLSILYTAAPSLPHGTQASGFGFSFANALLPPTVSNPEVADNDTLLNWNVFTKKVSTLPTITNREDFTPVISSHYIFEMAATEGKSNTINPPGIAAGNKDIFYLNFNGTNFTDLAFDLASFVELTAVRLQGFQAHDDDGHRVGSLFLAGKEQEPTNPVPEPGTLMLLGAGILGIAIYGKLRSKNA